MNKMRLTVLPVGQGTGTLIQVLDDNGVPVETMLCDLGTGKWKTTATGFHSGDFVVEELEKMAAPTLSAVFLSHGDEDHITLIPRVLKKFHPPSDEEPANETLVVERVWFGGAYKKYRILQRNVLLELKKYRPVSGQSNLFDFGRDATGGHEPLYTSPHGVEVYLLFGNGLAATAKPVREGTAKNTDNSIVNTESLVLLVCYGEPSQWIVLTADATALTLAHCNEEIENLEIGIAPVFSLTLPHHGSTTTTYALINAADKSDTTLAQTNVDAFVDAFKPRTASVSSGEVAVFRLPRARVIEDFGKTLDQTGWWSDPALKVGTKASTQHFYTAVFDRHQCSVADSGESKMNDEDNNKAGWPNRRGWHSARTTKAFYSTDYLRQPVPKGIPLAFLPGQADFDAVPSPVSATEAYKAVPWATGWAFEVTDQGVPSMGPVVEIANAEHHAALRMLYGELPPHRFVFLPSASADAEPNPAGVAAPAAAAPAAVVATAPREARPPLSRDARRARPLP
jgi:hypothetical protein